MTDQELLQAFVESNSGDAFAELVRRHSDWIYSMAARLLGRKSGAEDVVQAVFLVLAQKAGKLGAKTSIDRWLFRATRYSALHVLREEKRRRQRERIAAMDTNAINEAGESEQWNQIVKLLDEAVYRLSRQDQRAVLLRFYQGKTMAEIGSGLGTSEDAARKRIGRAVDRLRRSFSAKGIVLPAVAAGALLLDNTTRAAPAILTVSPSIQSANIARGIGHMMFITRIKNMAAVSLAVAVPLGVVAALPMLLAPKTAAVMAAPTTQPTAVSVSPYIEAINLADELKQSPDADLLVADAPLGNKTEELLARNSHIFELLHAGASIGNAGWGAVPGDVTRLMGQLSAVRLLFTMDILRARLRVSQKDFAGAQQDLLDAMALCRAIQRDPAPSLIVEFVRIAGEETVLKHWAAMLPSWPGDQMAKIPMEMKAISAWPFGDALRAEFVIVSAQSNITPEIKKSMAPFYEAIAKILDQPTLPPVEQFKVDLRDAASNVADPTAQMMVQVLSPSLAGSLQTFEAYQVRMAMFNAGIATVRDGASAAKSAVDPFGDGPFEYAPVANGFELSSKLLVGGKPVTMHFGQ